MADVITRFRLETNQFDSKLRDASQEMSKLSQQLQIAGKDFDRFAQKHVEAAKALGQTESGATNLKDKLRDLVSAYNNVAKAYNNLTAEQQKTDFGKAMAASLDQLQQRITTTKTELYSMKDASSQAGNGIGALNSIFGASITRLAGWGAAIATAKGALDVAKDAFFASEQNLDDWNKMVYSAQSTYEGFLTALNTGDVSGFLNKISTIVQAAREAYDAIDNLQTTQNIQSPQVSKRQAELQRMETMLRTGRYIAPVDGRTPTPGLNDGDKLSKSQKDRIAKQLENIITEMAGLTKKEVAAANNAIDKLYNEQALRLGLTKQQFLAGTENIETFKKNVSLGKQYQQWENNRRAAETLAARGQYNLMTDEQKNFVNTPNPYSQYKAWSVFKDDGELFQTILTNIKNRTAKEQEYYSILARSYRQINKAEGYKPYGTTGSTKDIKQEVEKLMTMQEGLAGLTEKSAAWFVSDLKQQLAKTEIGTDTFNQVFGKLADATAVKNLLEYAMRNGVDTAVFPKEELMEKLINAEDISSEQLQGIVDRINTYLKDKKIELDFAVGTVTESSTEEKGGDGKQEKKRSKWKRSQTDEEGNPYGVYGVAKMASGMNSLVGSVEQLGIELPEGMKQLFGGIQAVTNILTSIMTIVEAIEMIQSSTSFLPFFAAGGVIPHAAGGAFIGGNHYSGDVTPVWANAGELILNKSSQNNLASALQDAERPSAGGAQPFVSGEQIYLGLTNYLRRSGRGELMTARR